MEKQIRFCQSCGMPLTADVLGTNADGSKNEEYCIYCYKDGAFTGDFTMEEMAEFCAQFVDEYNKNTEQNLSREEYKQMLLQYYPNLKRWKLPAEALGSAASLCEELPHASSPLKQQLIEEINALGIKDLPRIDNLFVLQGSFVNMAYPINGNMVKLLDDNATYWGTQIERLRVGDGTSGMKDDGRCYGIACDEHYILVSEYGRSATEGDAYSSEASLKKDGTDAEIVVLKKR